MKGAPILPSQPRPGEGPKYRGDHDWAWEVLLGFGGLFLGLGLMDQVALWIPVRLGVPEYEFGTVASSLDALPLFSLGLVFVLAASGALGRIWGVRVGVVVALVAAAYVVAAAVMYGLNIPLALRAAKDPTIRLGIEKSIAKVCVQAIAYPVAYLWLARRSLHRIAKAKAVARKT